ncbi:unnamed protein product [Didymodactylos carnosus]|uniref:FH2 domain-containing protein n=1 Tax=Didymodactylos carnosus TaxID=1234261 RepID=A0A814APL2_9BILA|nr:unnamed protein product [Didymodactylos carnosus]CAF0993785.1 unnamed protein product [Didymodactylos carnosus]CAF3696538.1 unnamed protein product [Didymodactylos carnosus]CAF3763661.1 unnamed protein product [Didymodactylos carnosus]
MAFRKASTLLVSVFSPYQRQLKSFPYRRNHQSTETKFDDGKTLMIRNNLLLTTMNNGGIIVKKTSRSNSLPNNIYFQHQERCLNPSQKSLSTIEQLPVLVTVQQQKEERSLVSRQQFHSLLTRGKSLDYYLSRSKRYLEQDELSMLFTMLVTAPTSTTYDNDNDNDRQCLCTLNTPQTRDSVHSNTNVLKCRSNTLPYSITMEKHPTMSISTTDRVENGENKTPELTKSIASHKIISNRSKKPTTTMTTTTTNGLKRQQSKTKSDSQKSYVINNDDVHNVMTSLLDLIEETIKQAQSCLSLVTHDEINSIISDITIEVGKQNTVKTMDREEQNIIERIQSCEQPICPSVPSFVPCIPSSSTSPTFFSSSIPSPPSLPNFSSPIPPAPPMMMGIPSPPPFFPNSLAKPILPFKKPNRRTYDPKKDVKPLYWNKIVLNVNHSDAIWLNIEEATFDEDSLAKMFEKTVIISSKKITDQHSTTPSTKSSNGKETVKLLDEKRSRAIGIFISSRHLDVTTIKDYLLKCDTSCMNIETLTGVYNYQPTDDEIQLLEPYINDNQALDKPEQFLTGLLKISCMSDRLHCLVFEISFNETLSSIDAQLNTLLTACDELIHSTSLKQLLGLILAIGNFLNAKNNSRGCADGFGLNILPTLKDVKTKDNCSTLLNYLAEQYIKQFQMKKPNAFTNTGNDSVNSSNECLATLSSRPILQLSPILLTKTDTTNITKFQLPVPEPSDLLTASNVNFDEIERCIESLRTKINECQRRVDIVKDELDKNPKQNDDDDRFCQHVTTFLTKAQQEHSETNKQFKKAKSQFHETCKKFCIKAVTTSSTISPSSSTPSTNNDEMDPKEFFKLWYGFCNDFKDAWTKEKAKLLKNSQSTSSSQQYIRSSRRFTTMSDSNDDIITTQAVPPSIMMMSDSFPNPLSCSNIQSSEKTIQDTLDKTKIRNIIHKRVNNHDLIPDQNFMLKKRSKS